MKNAINTWYYFVTFVSWAQVRPLPKAVLFLHSPHAVTLLQVPAQLFSISVSRVPIFHDKGRRFYRKFSHKSKPMNFRLLPNKLYSNDKHSFLRRRGACTWGAGLKTFTIYQHQFESTLVNTPHIIPHVSMNSPHIHTGLPSNSSFTNTFFPLLKTIMRVSHFCRTQSFTYTRCLMLHAVKKKLMPTQIAVFITEVCQHFASFVNVFFRMFEFFFNVKILILLVKMYYQVLYELTSN